MSDELELRGPAGAGPPAVQPVENSNPTIIEGQVVDTFYRSPLEVDPETGLYPTALRGGVVTDLAQIEAIRRRVDYGALPWWRRALTRPPPGWRPNARPQLKRSRPAAKPITPTPQPLELTMRIPTIVCRECGTDAPNDEACGDPCCGRCSHPAKAVR